MEKSSTPTSRAFGSARKLCGLRSSKTRSPYAKSWITAAPVSRAKATAAALIVVGYLMVSALTEGEEEAEVEEGVAVRGHSKIAGIDFHDLAIGLPAALVIIFMPLTYSITNGIGFGFIAYTLIRVAQGQVRKVHPFMWVAAAAFTLYFLVPLLQDHVSWI